MNKFFKVPFLILMIAVLIVPSTSFAVDPEYDFCENIPGTQATLPNGLRRDEGSFECFEIPKVQTQVTTLVAPTPEPTPVTEYDFCSNIKGIQSTLPKGLRRDEGSFFCTEIPKTVVTPTSTPTYDWCTNIPDMQDAIPDGMNRPNEGTECVRIPITPEAPTSPVAEYDFCSNIKGIQATLPNGLRREEGSFDCKEIPRTPTQVMALGAPEPAPVEPSAPVAEYDFCSNIKGIQATLPNGLRREEGSFDCKEIPKVRSSRSRSTPVAYSEPEIKFELNITEKKNNEPVEGNDISTKDFQFTKDLSYGVDDLEVLELQKFLNKKGYIVSTEGFGSIGNETTYFGPRTRQALIKFQEDNNINPAVGFFGRITRTLVNTQI